MGLFFNKIKILFIACRGYSAPISFMSWLVPALFAFLNKGNLIYGLIALIGIVNLHLATNLFDDAIDYNREKREINKGKRKEFNFQKGKCICILNGDITIKQAYLISLAMFIFSLLIGLFFINEYGTNLLYIIIPSGIICILYPLLGCLGLGEILVSVIFSPFIYLGVYFVMTGQFSLEILILSISTGLLTVAVLHNHMLLDYKYDTTSRKITLCRICGSEKNALILLEIIILLAYTNLIFWVIWGKLNYIYLLPIITIPKAITLLKIMQIHINNPDEEIKPNRLISNFSAVKKAPKDQRNFLLKFMLVQDVLTSFTIILCISIVIYNYIINN